MQPSPDLQAAYRDAVAKNWSVLVLESGLRIPLTEVFVLLEAVQEPRRYGLEQIAPADVLALGERQEHLGPRLPGGENATALPIPLSQALQQARHLVLLGEPGSGKSTTLQYIGLCLARGEGAKIGVNEPLLPVLLRLQEWGEKFQSGGTLADALTEAVRRELEWGESDLPRIAELRKYWQAQPGLFLLLDGLDELSEGQRAARERIRTFIANYGATCRVAVASRPAGYLSLVTEVRDLGEFRLKPFGEEAEIRPYLRGYLTQLRPEWREDAETPTERLLAMIRQRPALKRLSDNPLLLRLLAEVYAEREGEELDVKGRADLYRRWVEEVAWQRAQERGLSESDKEEHLQRLEEAAWALHNRLPLPDEAELAPLREKWGLLVRLGERWAFAHQTFAEYFVARRLARAWRQNRAAAWAFLRPRLHLPEWRESFFLLAGLLEEHERAILFRRLLRARSPYERLLHRDLALAADWLGEGMDLPDRLRRALLARLERMLRSKKAGERAMAADLLGRTRAPQALPALLQALKDEDWHVRRVAAEALGKIGVPALPALLQALKDEGWHVRWAAAEALGELGQPEAVPALLQALKDKDEDVRRAAALALRKLGQPEAFSALLQALKDEDGFVRWAAAEALGELGQPEAVPALLQALKDKHEDVRRVAAWALGKLGQPEALPALLQALKDEDSDVRRAAAEALGKLGQPEAIPALLQALKDEDWSVREAAARALGELGKPEALPALLQALKDEDSDVRRAAAVALRELGQPEAIPALLQALKDEDGFVRWAAAEALGKLGKPEAILALLQALKDKHEDVRRAAAWALGELGKPEAIPALLQALKDEDSDVRRAAAVALGELGQPEAIPALLQALKDKEWLVREAAKKALGKLLPSLPLPLLRRLAQAASRAGEKDLLAAALEEIARREITYRDPFQPLWHQRAGRYVRWALAALLLGLAGLLAVALSVARRQLEAALQPLLGSQPLGVLVLAVFVLAALGGLLRWRVERWKK